LPHKGKEKSQKWVDPKIVMNSTLIERYIGLGRQFATYITDVSMNINEALDEGKHVMAEAAQCTHLDIIHGTQKFVTSSSTIEGSACASLWSRPYKSGRCDSYSETRVGAGPLPTEFTGELGERIQKTGCEFGTTTDRSRRCEWFDLPLLKKAIYLNGYTKISLTKLDVFVMND
jgi:adenylosuccinate synthase